MPGGGLVRTTLCFLELVGCGAAVLYSAGRLLLLELIEVCPPECPS